MFSNSKNVVSSEIRQRRHSTSRKSVDLFLLLRANFFLILVILVRTGSPQDTKAMIYLSQYGYLPPSVSKPSSSNLLSHEVLSHAVAEFQNFAGLNVTGELDEETIKLMETPRCGVKDKVGFATDSRSKRYALQGPLPECPYSTPDNPRCWVRSGRKDLFMRGSRWKVRDLTYKISKYPRALKKEHVDSEVKKAFGVWSKYTDLTFTQKKVGSVHIEIRFERGEHGDGDPFDGRGGTLAHAYFPVYGGDAHFDDDEVWTVDTFSGTNLFQVAAHEFGHSLGLSHSDVRAALMAPFYRGYQPHFELHEDDIEGIQALYGKKTRGGSDGSPSSKTTTESPNSVYNDPELCSSGSVDTVFNGPEKQTYVFRKDKYWKLTSDGVARGYPKSISKSWPGLPSNIDAAFTYKNGKTYFFKGKNYWRYTGKKMDGDYPKPISKGFEGIPDDIDAALVWSGNGKIYFFKDDKFWKFDPSSKPPVKKSYPKPISNWNGIPEKIDAALQYTNGYTYFFKKGAYWRFNDRNFQVDEGNPAFPRSSAHWWFGCKDATRGTLGNLIDGTPISDGDSSAIENEEEADSHVDDLILDAAGGPEERKTPDFNRSSSDLISPHVGVIVVCQLLCHVLRSSSRGEKG